MKQLDVRPLTQQNFAAFGAVIEADVAKSFLINEGTTRRYHALATVDVESQGGTPVLSIFEADERVYPYRIGMMERHPLGSQAFVPLSPHAWLVVVAHGDKPTAETCHAFLATGHQGVQYAKGVWHHPLLAITHKHRFLVVDRAGAGENLEEVDFDGNDVLVTPPAA